MTADEFIREMVRLADSSIVSTCPGCILHLAQCDPAEGQAICVEIEQAARAMGVECVEKEG